MKFLLSHDVMSRSDIMPYNKIDIPLGFTDEHCLMTSFISLRKRWRKLDVFAPKMLFLSKFYVM